MTEYIAYATTTEQAKAMSADDQGIMIQGFENTADEGQVYTGEDIYIETGSLTSEADVHEALVAAGWQVDGSFDTLSGQTIAKVWKMMP